MINREFVTLNELAKRWDWSVEEILETAAVGILRIYAFIDTEGLSYIYADKTSSIEIKGIYHLQKTDVLKLRFKEGQIEIRANRSQPSDIWDGNFDDLIFECDYCNWNSCSFIFVTSRDEVFLKLDEVKSYEDFIEIMPCFPATKNSIQSEKLPEELRIAIDVFYEFWNDRPLDMNPAKEETIDRFIQERANANISESAIRRIRTIARPDKTGGAPKSEAPHYKGKSKK